MAEDDGAPRASWHWMCADCHGHLAWIRDNVQGRHLLAVLVRQAEATAEELMQQGILRCVPDSVWSTIWSCCCGEHGPTLSAEILAQRQATASHAAPPRTGCEEEPHG